jgi:hypothetical protein
MKPTVSESLQLGGHPRLIAGAMAFRLRRTERDPTLAADGRQVHREAELYLAGTTFDYDKAQHNAHLVRAQIMQRRVLTLLAEWSRTGAETYRRAAVAHIRQMGRWPYWSWIAWRSRDRRPDAIYDLSYGENAATLAFAWDWLYPTLTTQEKGMMLAIARRWPFAAFRAGDKAQANWWFGKPDSNWNTVCAGGLGLLALAMMEDTPEAAWMLRRAEVSIRPYMKHLDAVQGGWPEGIGYWGYGMRYAFLYLLSWERATGRKHPLMNLPGTRQTVDFPLDFTPNQIPCSFGDSNAYRVHPFHYALAERLGRLDIVERLDQLRSVGPRQAVGRGWPEAVECLLFHPRRSHHAAGARRITRHYAKLDWYVLADRWPNPALYLAVRGGTTAVPHSHLDLTSFHCVVQDEGLIVNLGPHEYLDTTFGPRRWEVYEMTPASKNVVLVNGVGIESPARVSSRALTVGGFPAVRLDATEAMGRMRDGAVARFHGRLFVLFDDEAALVLDRIELRHFGRSEARFHTFGQVEAGAAKAHIRGERRRMTMAFASDVPCRVREAVDASTSPARESRMIRWCTQKLHRTMTLATLLTPGAKPGMVTVQPARGRLVVTVRSAGRKHRLVLSRRLQPM